jgi:competence ComEA-like helix-hairpin-helix protein
VVAEPETAPAPVELNTADSAALIAVSGIGNVLAVRILDYRERLGGYARAEQLREIPGMTDENYRRIIAQITVDSCEIRKIDINFASPQVVGRHPYMTPEGLRRLLKNRQLKGGWRSVEELVNENILTQEQAARLGPYLVFN